MNERIQKLADQCRTEYHNGYGGFTEKFDEEKFAELIVRECAVMCRWEHEAQVMLEHFGVDE
jgi:hypothetical protein